MYYMMYGDSAGYSLWKLDERELKEKKIAYCSSTDQDFIEDIFWHDVIWPDKRRMPEITFLMKDEVEKLLFLGKL